MPSINDRARVASNEGTPKSTLRELAADKSPRVREAVASNPATPAGVLDALVRDARFIVRFAVAENPSPHALGVALGAPHPDVRGAAARRDDLSATDIQLLLDDPIHTVREHLAEVVQDPTVAAALARDPHPAVRSSIVLNPRLSSADVEMLAQDPIARVRATAAASRRLRPDMLTGMAQDRSAQVRWSVLVNNPERLDLARIIADDADQMNAHQARAQLQSPRDFTEFLGEIDLVT